MAIDQANEQAQPRASHEHRRIIVGGHGQVGGAIGRALTELKMQYTVVEIDPDRAQSAAGTGCNAIFGDVVNPEVLESAGVAEADALILTMPNEQAVLAAAATARHRNQKLFIVARMGLERHEKQAEEVGADAVIVEELETAKAMRDAVLAHFGNNKGSDT